MNFLHEAAKITELPMEAFSGYRYMVAGGVMVYVAGHKGVKSFGPECVSFRVGRELLNISGRNLTLKHLSDNDAVVTGEIICVQAEKD